MATTAMHPFLSADAYLLQEEASEIKHEYLSGEIFAMAGASQAHGTVVINLATVLRPRLRGGTCRSFAADMKVRVEAVNAFFYPDVVVSCDPRDRATPNYITFPSLIIEVLSPSTAAFDLGKKFDAYRKIPSLLEYAVIDSESPSMRLFRRGTEGLWQIHGPSETVALDSVGVTLSSAVVYEDVTFDLPAAEP